MPFQPGAETSEMLNYMPSEYTYMNEYCNLQIELSIQLLQGQNGTRANVRVLDEPGFGSSHK